jgi:hypothetical protein
MADSTGRELTFGVRWSAASPRARRSPPRPGRPNIGLLLPASVGGALANIAASFAGKVVVNLNFTAGRESMDAAIERCGISHILTSQSFLKKAGLEPMPGMVFLEDLLREPPASRGRRCSRAARLLPASIIERLFVSPAATGCAGADHLLERQHRRAEGRDAVASQRALEHRRRHRALPADAGRRRSRRAAVLPFLRLHRDALAAAGSSASAPPIIRTRPTRRPSASSPRGTARRARQHPDLLQRLRAQDACPSSSRSCASPSSAPRRLREPVGGAFKERSASS